MKKIRHILALLLLPLVACTDWFDAVPDNGTIPDKKFFGDENAFYNALVDVYTQLRSNNLYGGNLTLGMLEFMGQDFVPYDTPSADISKFRYDTPENSIRIATIMREMYRAIASCNKILDEIEHTDVSFYNPGQKEIITGELYALRGALHFDLLRPPRRSPGTRLFGTPLHDAFRYRNEPAANIVATVASHSRRSLARGRLTERI